MARRGPNTAITGDASGLEKATKNAQNALGKMGRNGGKALKGLGLAAGGAGALLGGALAVGLKGAVEAAAEAEQVTAQTRAVLKSTGGVANVSAKQVDKLSSALSAKSGADDEAIASGQNVLLTFTGIRNEAGKGNDVFNQTTQAALDMSVALKTDMKSASMTLGKALNDPIAGMSKLTKQGVTFTQGQKDQAKAMVAAGDTAGAQKLILAELSKEFGGSAEAAGNTFTGKVNKAKVAMGNLQESIGGAVLPVLSKAATGFATLVSQLQSGEGPAGRFGAKVKEFVQGALAAIGPAVARGVQMIKQIAPTLMELGRNVVNAVGPAFRLAGQAIGQLQKIVLANLPAIKATFRDLGPVVKGVGNAFQIAFTAVSQILKVAGPGIKAALGGILTVIRGVMRVIGGILTGDFSKAWDGVKKIFSGAVTVIYGICRGLLALIGKALSNLAPLIGRAFKAAWEGAKNLTVNGLKALGNLLLKAPATYYGFMVKAGGAIVRGLGSGIKALAGVMRRGVESGVDVLTGLPGRFLNAGRSAGRALVNGLKGIPSMVGKALSGAGGIIGDIGQGLKNWLNKNTLLGNKVHIKIPGAPNIKFTFPKLASGGRIGGRASGGDRIPALLQGTEVVLNQRQQALVNAGMSISQALDSTGAPTIGGAWNGYAKGAKSKGMLGAVSSAAKKAAASAAASAKRAKEAAAKAKAAAAKAKAAAAKKKADAKKAAEKKKADAKKRAEAVIKKRQDTLDRSQSRYDNEQSKLDIEAAKAEATPDTADDKAVAGRQKDLINRQLKEIAKLRKNPKLSRAQQTGLNSSEAQLRQQLNTINAQAAEPAQDTSPVDSDSSSDEPAEDPIAAAALAAQEKANEIAAEMLAATKALGDLVSSQIDGQKRLELLTTTQGPQLMAAFQALLSGSIGGDVGRALGTPSYPGSVASY